VKAGDAIPKETSMLDYTDFRDGLVVTAFWKAKPEETEAVTDILRRFVPQARRDPGVQAFFVHQSRSEPSEFFFYEVFDGESAFEAHQKTPHFKSLIAGEALPKLVKRERTQYAFV
jgi:quinol monooxygenase YgiN